MPTPFDSSAFFRDPFFVGDNSPILVWATPGNSTTAKPIPAIVKPGYDPQKDGVFVKRGGKWAKINILLTDWYNRFGDVSPQYHQEIVVGEDTYRIEQFFSRGDQWKIYAMADQRRHMSP